MDQTSAKRLDALLQDHGLESILRQLEIGCDMECGTGWFKQQLFRYSNHRPADSGIKCARTACTSMNACCRHRDNGRLYCPSCRHAINEHNPSMNGELVMSFQETLSAK